MAAHRAGYAKPKTGLDLTRGIINDMARQTRLNEVSTRFADAHPDVHTIDLRGTVCLTGTPTPTLDGVPLCADGVHWTHEGIAAVWGGLAGQVSAVHDAG